LGRVNAVGIDHSTIRVEDDYRVGQTLANLLREKGGRSFFHRLILQTFGGLLPVGLQQFLDKRKMPAVSLRQFLAHGELFVLHGLIHEPQQADGRHDHHQQQQQRQPGAV